MIRTLLERVGPLHPVALHLTRVDGFGDQIDESIWGLLELWIGARKRSIVNKHSTVTMSARRRSRCTRNLGHLDVLLVSNNFGDVLILALHLQVYDTR